MERVKIISTGVNGAYDEKGRRLVPMGNINIFPGAYVWTDGRVIFGNLQAGGGAPVIPVYEDMVLPAAGIDGIYDALPPALYKLADRQIYGYAGNKRHFAYISEQSEIIRKATGWVDEYDSTFDAYGHHDTPYKLKDWEWFKKFYDYSMKYYDSATQDGIKYNGDQWAGVDPPAYTYDACMTPEGDLLTLEIYPIVFTPVLPLYFDWKSTTGGFTDVWMYRDWLQVWDPGEIIIRKNGDILKSIPVSSLLPFDFVNDYLTPRRKYALTHKYIKFSVSGAIFENGEYGVIISYASINKYIRMYSPPKGYTPYEVDEVKTIPAGCYADTTEIKLKGGYTAKNITASPLIDNKFTTEYDLKIWNSWDIKVTGNIGADYSKALSCDIYDQECNYIYTLTGHTFSVTRIAVYKDKDRYLIFDDKFLTVVKSGKAIAEYDYSSTAHGPAFTAIPYYSKRKFKQAFSK